MRTINADRRHRLPDDRSSAQLRQVRYRLPVPGQIRLTTVPLRIPLFGTSATPIIVGTPVVASTWPTTQRTVVVPISIPTA